MATKELSPLRLPHSALETDGAHLAVVRRPERWAAKNVLHDCFTCWALSAMHENEELDPAPDHDHEAKGDNHEAHADDKPCKCLTYEVPDDAGALPLAQLRPNSLHQPVEPTTEVVRQRIYVQGYDTQTDADKTTEVMSEIGKDAEQYARDARSDEKADGDRYS
eukprot:gnl/TRDRNA2_/TRDRNA2_58177_c0_seq1.p2 gnl/TRDRNA2_/TRDRNA2_58177_c0~~gnl/TRDRNA2_/TRDRNA2_58177_c0_seq1.p2  ORF type:complete len:164 (-),score=36.49 gnl/TRDRNA2_/TRDRNA2_58177_c0_seq1:301-792(-)